MIVLILMLVVGAMLVYISKFNFMMVSVNLGWWIVEDIPLFYVIVASLLVGLILSYVAYVFNAIFTSYALRGKDKEIKKGNEQVLELTKRVHQLELENERIKRGSVSEPEDEDSL